MEQVKGNSELGATIESAAAKCLGGLTKPQDDGTEKSKMELAPKAKNVELQVKIPVVHSKFQKRLPPVSVAGKREQLETVIRDKIMQRGQGGAHQLRKAFMVFDANGARRCRRPAQPSPAAALLTASAVCLGR